MVPKYSVVAFFGLVSNLEYFIMVDILYFVYFFLTIATFYAIPLTDKFIFLLISTVTYLFISIDFIQRFHT